VVVIVDNRANDLAAFLAVWTAGHVAVPLSARSAAHCEELVARTGAAAVIDVGASPVVRRCGSTTPRTYAPGDALILMTSGSTGRPKLLLQTHARLCAKFDAIRAALPMDGGSHRSAAAPQGESHHVV
jgi:acyl-CoA synthetase (AMP-forming)/AMP-acid ligase II